jgi:phosphoglycerate kinase
MMNRLKLQDLALKGKKALVRVDFNVPQDKSGKITDDTRIREALPTIQYVLNEGGSVILMSHLGRPKGKNDPTFSLRPIAKRLEELLGKPVRFANDCNGPEAERNASDLREGEVLLLENLRFHEAEEKPEKDPSFAKKLASLGDLYVNDAFGTAHRKHSSTFTIAQYFPNRSAAGFLIQKEIDFLSRLIVNPERPFYAIIGGAKVSTKMGVLKSLLRRIDGIFIGGGMAYTFFKAQGISIGNSIFEEASLEEAKEFLKACIPNVFQKLEFQHSRRPKFEPGEAEIEADPVKQRVDADGFKGKDAGTADNQFLKHIPYNSKKVKLFLPVDLIIADAFQEDATAKTISTEGGIPEGWQGVDIGPKTLKTWKHALSEAATVFWNGPLGVFEFPRFAKGTEEIAKTVAHLEATTVVGGGDSVSAINALTLSKNFSHVSTGGGASLEFLEFGELPGINVLSIVK